MQQKGRLVKSEAAAELRAVLREGRGSGSQHEVRPRKAREGNAGKAASGRASQSSAFSAFFFFFLFFFLPPAAFSFFSLMSSSCVRKASCIVLISCRRIYPNELREARKGMHHCFARASAQSWASRLTYLDFELKRRATRNFVSAAVGSVAQIRWDCELPLLADAHPSEAIVPPLDDLTLS